MSIINIKMKTTKISTILRANNINPMIMIIRITTTNKTSTMTMLKITTMTIIWK